MKKYVFTLAVTALITGTSLAAINGKKPAFMDKQQLAAMRTEAKTMSTAEITEGSAFFTGKPYMNSGDRYAFKYRSYSPTIARWTSDDPSGFPDGANVSFYAPNVCNEVDPDGLKARLSFENQVHSISLNAYVIGDHMTISTLSSWKNAIESAWNFSGTDTSNQQTLAMNTSVGFKLHEGGSYDQNAILQQYDNIIRFSSDPNHVSVVLAGGREGIFDLNAGLSTIIHEFGHFMLAPDRYTVSTVNGQRVTTPWDDWGGTIMGAGAMTATKLDANLVLKSLGENTHLFE